MCKYYDEEQLQEISANVDLLEYAQQSYSFTKKSGSYFTNCPNHVDLTPSLSITPEKNQFHCFSCGAGGTIINWLKTYENLSFDDSVKKAARLANITISDLKTPSAMMMFSRLREKQQEEKQIEREILDSSYLNEFSNEIPQEWVDEGISADVMKRYQIKIDNKSNRIIYPVYDNDFNLIGVKGRTRFSNYKQLGLQKYMNYKKIGTTDFFVGMKENKEAILNKNEVIIFEGIKSGMKAEGWGYDNWLASDTSCLNDEQVKILLKLHIKDVVIAYDNDVDIHKIDACTELLRKFMNVYYVIDKKKILGSKKEKLSPVDKGRDIWERLYNERKKRN